MKENNLFQTIFLFVLGIIIVVAVLMFSGVLPGGISPLNKKLSSLTVWGPWDEPAMVDVFGKLKSDPSVPAMIEYQAKNPATYEQELIEAFASGRGPDLFFISQENLYRFEDKIYPLSYDTLPERTFRDTYVQNAEILLSKRGILSTPMFIDPLVLYYNRDLLSSANIVSPPQTWDQFLTTTRATTILGPNNTLKQSGTALGQFNNIRNAKAILSLLFYQTGSQIVTRQSNDSYKVAIVPGNSKKQEDASAESAVNFFLQFTDPTKATYAWNASLPEAQDQFAAGLLATYFGFGSEISAIKAKNPHLNIDVSLPPQNTGRKVDFGNLYGLAISRLTKQPALSAQLALYLSSQAVNDNLASSAGLQSVRRDVLSKAVADPFQTIMRQATVVSLSWVDALSDRTRAILANMTQSIQLGRNDRNASVYQAEEEMNLLYNKKF